MAKLSEVNFQCGVTEVDVDSIDEIIKLFDSNREANLERAFASLNGEDESFDADAFNSFCRTPGIAFSLYKLAIFHCYSMVEKNRKSICLKIPGLSAKTKKYLYTICSVTACLEEIGVKHKEIEYYETMDEFRSVNNAIKHDGYSFSRVVTTKDKEYGRNDLRVMYLDRVQYLNIYLSDLYEKVMASPCVVENL